MGNKRILKNPFSKFTEEEIDSLRLMILNATQNSIGKDPSYLVDPLEFIAYISEPWDWPTDIVKAPFKDLPTLMYKPPAVATELWWESIIKWRLQIGK